MNITPQMLHLLHHTLGLRPDRRESFRNHFLAGPGHHDQPDLEALESAGLMRRVKTPAFCDRDDVTFVCTPAGKDYAIDNLPAPPPEPKRNNYRDFIEADAGYSFSEWLGINKPVYEVRGRWGNFEYRMYRLDRSLYQIHGTVSGDWKPTKKAAKESYKVALNKYRDNCTRYEPKFTPNTPVLCEQ